MKIGYFCYNLSGTGPSVRAQDIINGVSESTEHEVVVLTSETERVSEEADKVVPVSIKNPVRVLWKVLRHFNDCDVVHVPINIYQVVFVRMGYYGPLVAGVGPGIQQDWHHIQLARLARIGVKIRTHKYQTSWTDIGIGSAQCMGTIDTDLFYPYPEEKRRKARNEIGVSEEEDMLLYVGEIIEEQGAGLVDEMAREHATDDTVVIVVGKGDEELEDRLEKNENLRYEGFVANKKLPKYYNTADITLGPRIGDVTSNVGLESIACGTPFITTAVGLIKKLFYDEGTYVWAERTPEGVWETAQELLNDEERYDEQVKKGLETLEKKPLTLEGAVDTHIDVLRKAVEVTQAVTYS
ncbi:MAG: glycosyltransferase family 4 protein [Halobacteriales archaeon]|nr:glycosyltransferase family 4 protein [Halobacteriales archaeon]